MNKQINAATMDLAEVKKASEIKIIAISFVKLLEWLLEITR